MRPPATSPIPLAAHAPLSAVQPPPIQASPGLFQRFLDGYAAAEKNHRYLTGVATASMVYIVGDTIAQCVTPGIPVDVSLTRLGTLIGMSLYYGWESPKIFHAIEHAFPLDKKPSPKGDQSTAMVEGAKIMTGQTSVGSGLARLGNWFVRKIKGLGRFIRGKKQEVLRTCAYRIPIAPFWTMRHMAVLNAIHGTQASTGQMVEQSLVLWGTWLPLLSVEEYIVQNKIPLQFRFLAISAVGFVWQMSASLIALLRSFA